jgi:hypothetical protein
MRKIDHVDLTTSGEIVYNFKKGEPLTVDKEKVLEFIEAQELHASTQGPGLTSDPHEREETIYIDLEEYLEDNFEYITNLFYKKELCKQITSTTELAY